MSKEMAKAYEPSEYEDEIYKKWEEGGFFNPDSEVCQSRDNKKNKGYTIVMPPPNVTGTLHMGHASMLALEDILTRFYRMQGYDALWLPGTDHAAIATQTKVEKIIKEEGTNRHEMGREKFLERVRQFAQDSHDTIVNQTRKMGSSCDWTREAYTLDETRSKAVRSVFKLMYDDGLIYRGERIVNWCPRCKSTLADDEVEYKEQKAKFYTFKYDKNFPISISTTRPETKLGDVAVAVNPKDERYKEYIGKTYEVDFCGVSLKIKVIGDRHVDMEFGTGALGVTPAHSAVDWQMAEENELEIIKVIDEDGNIKEGFGKFSHQTAIEAREMVVKELKKRDLIEEEEEIDNNLSICYRCDTAVEPLPSLQWFINVNKKIDRLNGKSIKEICVEAVERGVFGRDKINIVPPRFEKNYFHWMNNLRDWCISRQILFGHQVPVWYRGDETYVGVEEPEDETNFVFLHGFYRTQDVKDPLKWLSQQLEKKDNFYEILPDANKPNKEKQTEFVLKNAKINENTVIVTHSVGGVLALKMIEENDLKIKKLVLISTSLEKPEKRKIEELESYNKGNKFDFDKIKSLVGEIVFFQASEDHVLTEEEQEEAARKLGARLIKVEDSASHFNQEESQEILEELKKNVWTQDTDTLDTWFSSGLWTFSTLASSPDQIKIEDGKLVIDSDDFKHFHPTAVLETGYDILFFWVARMIIMTTYAVNDIPFQDVYMHGLVLDDKGKKMSKSKGNVIDPLDMIKKYGTDAARLSLVMGSTPGNDLRLSEEKIIGFRNVVNKLWNVSRFIISQNQESKIKNQEIDENKLTLADKWILTKLKGYAEDIDVDLKNYQFSSAGDFLQTFTWSQLADWYLEASKFQKGSETEKVLFLVLRTLLKLWHPFIPFVTEVIWKEFNDTDLIVEKWPDCKNFNKFQKEYDDFNIIREAIVKIRDAKPGNIKADAVIYAGERTELIKSQAEIIKSLKTGIQSLKIEKDGEEIKDAVLVSVGDIKIYLIVEVNKEKETERIKKEVENLEKVIKQIENKLGNKEFVEKAPKEVVEREQERLDGFKKELKAIKI